MPPEFRPNLDAYLARLDYRGSREPTLSNLNAIVAAHVEKIPLENADVLLGRGISLDPAAIERKLIGHRRGGYCFEQNGYLLLVLRELGFITTSLSARVRLQRSRDIIPPRTHLFVRVEVGGESWLVDAGIGSLSLTTALRLQTDLEQPTLHETRRIVREGPRLFHQFKTGTDWEDVCEFTLEEMPQVDRELANWWTSTHPESKFRLNVVAGRSAGPGLRYTLLNRDFTVRRTNGPSESRTLSSPAELMDVLGEKFGLVFPAGTEFTCPGLVWS